MNDLDTELLERATLAAEARWSGASVIDLKPLEGGVSSLTFAARLTRPDDEDRRIVVKVAPPGLPPVRNRDVLRQARLLKALAGAPGVRVPEVLLEDAGLPPFFVMSFAAGQSYEPRLDAAGDPPTPEVVNARARAAVEMLARLQQVAPDDVGLADEPVTSIAEELDRWAQLFATVPEELQHGQVELYQRLAGTVPEPLAPRILHGDYRLGNLQCAADRVEAIIDWEIWSLGDPRHDLAWLLTWVDPIQRFHEDRGEDNLRAGTGMPSTDDLLAVYAAVRPVDIPDLDWFEAYCRYKMASTTAALIKHSRRRATREPHLELAATTLPAMVSRGVTVLDAAHVLR